MNLRRGLLAILLIYSSVLGSGCEPKDGLSAHRSLKIQLGAEPVSLDPALAEDGISFRVLMNVMVGLVSTDASGALKPELAERYEISPDGRRYIFYLRKNAFWSDGAPVRAEDFVRSMTRVLNPETASKYAHLFYPIRGARNFNTRKSGPQQLGIRAENEKLILELEEPAPYLIQVMTMPIGLPIRETGWSEAGPVTGPYRIASHQISQRYLLERNLKYWGFSSSNLSEGRPETVEFTIVSDESTGVNLFEGGKLDILTKIPSTELKRFEKKGWIRKDPYPATYYLGFNVRKPPFQDRRWRQAVSGAISRKEIVGLLDSGETPARSWIPAGLEGYIPYEDPTPVFSHAMAQVREELRKKSKRAYVSAAFDSSSRNSLIMTRIQQDLLKNLGLRVDLNNLDWKSYIQLLHSDAPPIYRFGMLAPFLDPIVHLKTFTSKSPTNDTGWSNAVYDALVEEISQMKPGPERAERVIRAQRILVDEEAVVVPIYHYVQNHAVSSRVRDFKVNPFGVIRLSEIGVEK